MCFLLLINFEVELVQVRRVDVDNYTPHKTLITCQVMVHWARGDKPPTLLSHLIKLDGAKEFEFLTVTAPSRCIGMWYVIICTT